MKLAVIPGEHVALLDRIGDAGGEFQSGERFLISHDVAETAAGQIAAGSRLELGDPVIEPQWVGRGP